MNKEQNLPDPLEICLIEAYKSRDLPKRQLDISVNTSNTQASRDNDNQRILKMRVERRKNSLLRIKWMIRSFPWMRVVDALDTKYLVSLQRVNKNKYQPTEYK